MDYLFENLGDERFQEFCSTLLTKEFPDTQSFPVGQPDGGRDSLAYIMDATKKDFCVFQVKYVRNPNNIADIHKWLTKIIKDEAPKINKLIPRGAKKYYLLTNVRGTAHLDIGSKDKVNKILEEQISIPSLCWWRDDLSRMFEKDTSFKWSFPEIINGQDILNSILFQNINENKERRESIIKAYLVDQFAIDNEVKFKQIDLQNKLLDLFTDVPIRIKKLNEKDRKLRIISEFFESNHRNVLSRDSYLSFEEIDNVGAASFLLHARVQENVERALLEGGPGQGKSTISQYICQVHRARLLNKKIDLNLIPDLVKQTPVRLPFKIDLRHIALWVEKKNPYLSRLGDENFNLIWRNSLESFLTGHILYHSQSDTFNSDDLLAILKHSSVLFVFDGFDEIADLKIRKEVIDFINKGINRIKENSRSIQIVITSRPAAFSDSIGFSVDEYPHFQLCDITPKTTKDYVEKWIKASRLDSREGAEIRRLVEEKLKLPHLKDLAKSPMQLAIFISLLRTRGESLPNKRTALYDSYIELFFNRESEKNYTIRDHRDLIIDIHQYIAWILHSEAELYRNSGSITIEDLKQKLKLYLTKEGHETDIADKLFHVLQERVCALVSRVQGTYEFEVQPLREYFCAKYLYSTSPYSPPGNEKPGTKPERFNAIAKNYYWHNVVRFFAGCFDKGELPMLIQELKELQNDELLKYTNYPSLITSQILSDWVFTQYPILMKDVVKLIVNGINIGKIINQDNRLSNSDSIMLPYECGRKEIFNECFEQLKLFPKKDYAYELIKTIIDNPVDTLEIWEKEVFNYSGSELVKWLEYGYLLQIIHKIDISTLEDIVKRDSLEHQERKIQIILNGNRFDVIEQNSSLKEILLNGVLSNDIVWMLRNNQNNGIQFLSMLLRPFVVSNILDSNHNEPFIYFLQRLSHSTNDVSKMDFNIIDDTDIEIQQIFNDLSPILNLDINSWKTSIGNWDVLIERLRAKFEDSWALRTVAIISSGIKSRNEKFENFHDISNSEQSLCKRTRCARLKSGSARYWLDQISNTVDIAYKLSIFFTWATVKTIINLYEHISELILTLKSEDIQLIFRTLRSTIYLSIFNRAQSKEIINFLKKRDGEDFIKLLIGLRLHENYKYKFIYNNINNNIPDYVSGYLNEVKYEYIVGAYLNDTKNEKLLDETKKYYAFLDSYEYNEYVFHRYYYDDRSNYIPIKLAQKIMNDAKLYPRIIASLAERSCRRKANRKTLAVGEIANENKWFE